MHPPRPPAAPARRALHALVRTPLRRRLLVVDGLALAAAVACGLSVAGEPLPVTGLLGAVLLLLLGRSVRVPLRLGERRVLVSAYAEGAILLTVLLVPVAWVPLLAGLVTLLGQLPRRLPVWRALFNAAALLGPVACSVAVYSAVAGDGSSVWRTVLGLLLACPVISLLNLAAVSGVVAAAHGEPWFLLARRDVAGEVVGMAVQATAVAAVVVAWQSGQHAAAVLVPVLGALVLRGVLMRLHQATEVDALQRLREATRPVRELDPAPAAAVLLQRAVALFGVHAAELALTPVGARPARRWHSEGTDAGEVHEVAGPTSLQGHVVGHALHDPDGTPLGELVLQFPRPPQFSSAERQVLDAFLTTVTSAVSACQEVFRREDASRRDPLTGLGNRADLDARVRDVPGGRPVALLLFGLSGSRRVAGTFGDAAGERMLLEVADRLRDALRPGDTAVRLGQHEFAALLHPARGEEQAVALACARRLLDRLDLPLDVDGYELPLEAQVGIAHGRGGTTDADTLLRMADAALAEAQRRGLPHVEHSEVATDDSVQLLGQLHSGLRLGEIEVHYQPLQDLRDGRVVGAEALVRWRHPVLGLLPPSRFVPLAEQTRLVLPLTLEVLDQAVAQAVRWGQDCGRPLSVAVNVSPRCLLRPDLPSEVMRVLALHGLPARLLTLEITETLALTDLPQVDQVLRELRDVGVRLSLDDFGTGFSSMSTLRRTVVDEVKIDRSFVAGAVDDASDLAVVEAAVALARGLGIEVVAEGIETAEQLALVRRLGCDQGQGYLLGRPSPRLQAGSRVGARG